MSIHSNPTKEASIHLAKKVYTANKFPSRENRKLSNINWGRGKCDNVLVRSLARRNSAIIFQRDSRSLAVDGVKRLHFGKLQTHFRDGYGDTSRSSPANIKLEIIEPLIWNSTPFFSLVIFLKLLPTVKLNYDRGARASKKSEDGILKSVVLSGCLKLWEREWRALSIQPGRLRCWKMCFFKQIDNVAYDSVKLKTLRFSLPWYCSTSASLWYMKTRGKYQVNNRIRKKASLKLRLRAGLANRTDKGQINMRIFPFILFCFFFGAADRDPFSLSRLISTSFPHM